MKIHAKEKSQRDVRQAGCCQCRASLLGGSEARRDTAEIGKGVAGGKGVEMGGGKGYCTWENRVSSTNECSLHKRLLRLETTILEASLRASELSSSQSALPPLALDSLKLNSPSPLPPLLNTRQVLPDKCPKPQVAPVPDLPCAGTRYISYLHTVPHAANFIVVTHFRRVSHAENVNW